MRARGHGQSPWTSGHLPAARALAGCCKYARPRATTPPRPQQKVYNVRPATNMQLAAAPGQREPSAAGLPQDAERGRAWHRLLFGGRPATGCRAWQSLAPPVVRGVTCVFPNKLMVPWLKGEHRLKSNCAHVCMAARRRNGAGSSMAARCCAHPKGGMREGGSLAKQLLQASRPRAVREALKGEQRGACMQVPACGRGDETVADETAAGCRDDGAPAAALCMLGLC